MARRLLPKLRAEHLFEPPEKEQLEEVVLGQDGLSL